MGILLALSSHLPSCSVLLLLLLLWRIDGTKAWMLSTAPSLVGQYGHQEPTSNRVDHHPGRKEHCFLTSSSGRRTAAPSSLLFTSSSGTQKEDAPSAAAASATISSSSNNQPHLIFPGGGILFYWMAGVVTHLREQDYNLESVALSGASAGALAATLTATNVDFYRATELALQLAQQAGVWDRSQGLQGIWGDLIHEWLDELLPEDAVDRVHNRLSLLVTPVPQILQKERIDSFHNREDLIRCNMASVHLPYFLDSKWTSNFRGRQYMDGSFLAKAPDDYHNVNAAKSPSILLLDYRDDATYQSQGLLNFVEAVKPSGIYQLIEDGKRYAKQKEEQGFFASLSKNGH